VKEGIEGRGGRAGGGGGGGGRKKGRKEERKRDEARWVEMETHTWKEISSGDTLF
jgi:hypothetical protein